MIRSGPWSAAMDVGDWLRSLGLGQYEALFRASEIDAALGKAAARTGCRSNSRRAAFGSSVRGPPRL
jgi:hypothetical protein